MIFRAVAIAALASGCAPVPQGSSVPVAGEGRCDAAKVQRLVGEMTSEAVFADALARSGAIRLRRLTPGAMMTMDYRGDRLNVAVDARGRVTRITCG